MKAHEVSIGKAKFTVTAARWRVETHPIATSYVLDTLADVDNDSGAVGAQNVRHCYARASYAEPIPNIDVIERRRAEFHDRLPEIVASRLRCIFENQLIDAAVPVHSNSFQSASR